MLPFLSSEPEVHLAGILFLCFPFRFNSLLRDGSFRCPHLSPSEASMQVQHIPCQGGGSSVSCAVSTLPVRPRKSRRMDGCSVLPEWSKVFTGTGWGSHHLPSHCCRSCPWVGMGLRSWSDSPLSWRWGGSRVSERGVVTNKTLSGSCKCRGAGLSPVMTQRPTKDTSARKL